MPVNYFSVESVDLIYIVICHSHSQMFNFIKVLSDFHIDTYIRI